MNDETPPPNTPPSQPVILTGMKPGQSFEEFKRNTIASLKERGFFAPKQPGDPTDSQEAPTISPRRERLNIPRSTRYRDTLKDDNGRPLTPQQADYLDSMLTADLRSHIRTLEREARRALKKQTSEDTGDSQPNSPDPS